MGVAWTIMTLNVVAAESFVIGYAGGDSRISDQTIDFKFHFTQPVFKTNCQIKEFNDCLHKPTR